MTQLAIVIPAYKIMYFQKAIQSIASQSCKDFTLYIGIDASPYDFKPLIDLYKSKINIVTTYFTENLGGKDLVAQWERCIDLVGDEEWIWLFSDDDFMDPNCVANFYLSLDQNQDFDLFHFNLLKVDEQDKATYTQFATFPQIVTIEDFLPGVLQSGYYSTAVEYIFRKSHFYSEGRFQNFDLAWFSDAATWIKVGKRKGIRTIESSKVYWRQSSLNISFNHDEKLLIRELYAQLEFSKWICKQATENKINFEISFLKKLLLLKFFQSVKDRIKFISAGQLEPLVNKLYLDLYEKKPKKQKILLMYFYKMYSSLKNLIKNFISLSYPVSLSTGGKKGI